MLSLKSSSLMPLNFTPAKPVIARVGRARASRKSDDPITPRVVRRRHSDSAPYKTRSGEAIFWSGKTNGIGGPHVAEEIASSQGGMTLEKLIESRGITLPAWDASSPHSRRAWEEASKAYAESARGSVPAVIGDNMRLSNIWETVELPTLKANPNVTEIIRIDPATGTKVLIYTKGTSAKGSETHDISTAIIAYLGYGTSIAPWLNQSALADVASGAPGLEEQVKTILMKLDSIEVDWSLHSLQSAAKEVRQIMSATAPDLTPAALDALEWKYTFDWR